MRPGVRTFVERHRRVGRGYVLVSNRAQKLLAVRNPPPAEPAHVFFVNVCEHRRFCARDRAFVLGGTLPEETVKFKQEYLFPAVILADLDLEPINPADQFVLTYLAVDFFPVNAGGLPPGTVDLGLGFRLGFHQLQHPNLRTSQKNRHVPRKFNEIRNYICEVTFISVPQIHFQIFSTLLGRSLNSVKRLCYTFSLKNKVDFVVSVSMHTLYMVAVLAVHGYLAHKKPSPP